MIGADMLLQMFGLGLFLLATLALGVWVGVAILATAVLGLALFTAAPPEKVLSTAIWGATANWPLTALPMFIWMGEILFRTRLAESMFRALTPWFQSVPGGLLHINVASSALFAAVSGSSAATAATIGRLTLPELARRGYDQRAAMGSLAASGTLGMLIPPSIVLIVYGVAAEVSIARLFMAGVIPGVLLATLFSGYIVVVARLGALKSPLGPEDAVATWADRFRSLVDLTPILMLIALVIGSIYSGLATPTEAAAVGVVGALAIAGWSGTLNGATLRQSLISAVVTSTMIMFILAAAATLSIMLGLARIPPALAGLVTRAEMSGPELIVILTLGFIVLGCFLDGISIVLLTTALILPAATAVGIDPIWFGIYLVVVVEMSQITPPVGFNLFVVQGLTGADMLQVARASLPYFVVMVAFVALILVFPEIVTFLPNTMLN